MSGPEQLACRACGESMEKGWIADQMSVGGLAMKWRPGDIRFYDKGSSTMPQRPVVPEGRRLPEVLAWRCTACGLLEFYAP